MLTPQPSPSMYSPTDNNIRKRVCQACDRCRLKKSKCDGASPCSRCKADNAICVFGKRKKSFDKVYPKGYVEMLEQQQNQLVAGLREMYNKLNMGEGWPGAPLTEQPSGHPLTHDILERLDLLQTKEGSDQYEPFEDFAHAEKRMRDEEEAVSATPRKRRGSVGSDSEHGHLSVSTPGHISIATPSSNGTPPTPPKSYFDHIPPIGALPTPPPTMSSLSAQHFSLGRPPMKSAPPLYDRGRGMQPVSEMMRLSFPVEAPVMEDTLPPGLNSFDTNYMDGNHDQFSFAAMDMGDPWGVTSIDPSALQKNWHHKVY